MADTAADSTAGEKSSAAIFTEKELRYFRKMFDMFDADHSGAIGFFEMKNLTKHLGVEMTDAALRASMEEIDENGNGDLEFDEFVQWLSKANESADEFAVLKSKIRAQGTRPLSNAQIDQLRDVFKHFDSDGSGSIDITELGSVFEAMGQKLSQEELETLMKQADDDGSGEMEFEEFLLLMCSNFGSPYSFDQELLESFHRYDPLKTGVVSAESLQQLIRDLVGASHLTDEEVKEVVEVACSARGDGYVEYMQWDTLWDACRGITL
jgi:calmodulin